MCYTLFWLLVLFNSHKNPLRGGCHYLHFADKEVKAQKAQTIASTWCIQLKETFIHSLIYSSTSCLSLYLSMHLYASKFGKPSSGHRTGKGQFSFQSQRKAMSKKNLKPFFYTVYILLEAFLDRLFLLLALLLLWVHISLNKEMDSVYIFFIICNCLCLVSRVGTWYQNYKLLFSA